MSQLVRAIKAHDTNKEIAVQSSLSSLLKDVLHIDSSLSLDLPNRLRIYEIGVKLGRQWMIDEDSLYRSNIDLIKIGKEQAKLEIIEAVFGEFREDFIKLKRALYEHSYPYNEKALKILKEFETKMFSEE
jgi:hypothetical protein